MLNSCHHLCNTNSSSSHCSPIVTNLVWAVIYCLKSFSYAWILAIHLIFSNTLKIQCPLPLKSPWKAIGPVKLPLIIKIIISHIDTFTPVLTPEPYDTNTSFSLESLLCLESDILPLTIDILYISLFQLFKLCSSSVRFGACYHPVYFSDDLNFRLCF